MPSPEKKAIGRFYRPELDLLRFIAFLMVFSHHALGDVANPLVQQFVAVCGTGVQIFFLLSAYLITELLLQEQEQTGTIHLRAFYVRRVLRIWPLYFLFLAFVFFLARFLHKGIFSTGALLAFLLLSGNWWVHSFGWLANAAGHLWSIAVEEQFYLIWPFVVRFGRRRAATWCSILFLVLGAIAGLYVGRHTPVPRHAYWTNSFLEFEFFATGSLLALYFHHKPVNDVPWKRALYLVAGVGLILICCTSFSLVAEQTRHTYDLLAGFLLLTVAIGLIFRAFLGIHVPQAANPMVTLGKISYGLYVFHYGLLIQSKKLLLHIHHNDLAGAVLASLVVLLLTILMAQASYRFIERPFLHLKQRFTFVKSRVD